MLSDATGGVEAIKQHRWLSRGLLSLALSCLAAPAFANPYVAPGDLALRHDIQRLADAGIITGTVTSWPLSWGAIISDIESYDDAAALPDDVKDVVARIRARSRRVMRLNELQFSTRLSVVENPTAIRSFQDTPREDAELGLGLSWTSKYLSIDLVATVVDSPQDDQDYRADGSAIGIALGNYTVAISAMDRWWGPGWDGSLILSNNARPMPALVIDRNLTTPFSSKWLSWIGPWDVSLIFGEMESERVIPNTKFFGMRVNFRPIPSLEIGLSRTAQWCGDGRPCDVDTFIDLFSGKDNVGDDGTTGQNEPGNQLAGIDFRWSNHWFSAPMAFYGQFIGEDEAGGFPSRYLGQGGVEISGMTRRGWSYRWFAELAITNCKFLESVLFNCAYNHSIYGTGYRYRGRAVGHASDNDARIASLGMIMINDRANLLHVLLRGGELNRGGDPDSRNTLTPTPQDIISIDLSYSRRLGGGMIDIGLGFERLDDALSGLSSDDTRAWLRWRRDYF